MTEGPRTALVIPVPEAAGLVPDPVIALLDPFLARHAVDDGVARELAEFFADLVPFGFVLGEPARFPSGATYLPPSPVSAFRRIVHELRRAFPEVLPEGGPLEAVGPHLAVPAGLTLAGPITAHARVAELRVREPTDERVLETFPFGASAA